jgi:hypothetical protein
LLGFGLAIQANDRLLFNNYKSDLSNKCDRLSMHKVPRRAPKTDTARWNPVRTVKTTWQPATRRTGREVADLYDKLKFTDDKENC